MFAGLRTLEAHASARVLVLEKSSNLLSKVKVSGGGRCNVTHAAFEVGELVKFYPRGQRELRGAFSRFQPRDMVAWLGQHGVHLKTEADGRMFPVSDDSQTIIDCFCDVGRRLGLEIRRTASVAGISKDAEGFAVKTETDEFYASRVLVAVGGLREGPISRDLELLGHRIGPLVPSLFTFKIDQGWVRKLAGLSVETVRVKLAGSKVDVEGPLLFTHWGMSGPAILKASAWGARELAEKEYRFRVLIDWLPAMKEDVLRAFLQGMRQQHGKALVKNYRPEGLPSRLWEALLEQVGGVGQMSWNQLPKKSFNQLIQMLKVTELNVQGKSMNKEEFVTCGGVSLKEIDFKSCQSRKCEGLYFAGECLDIDGLTGGFNFQAAWTTAEMVARSVSESLCKG